MEQPKKTSPFGKPVAYDPAFWDRIRNNRLEFQRLVIEAAKKLPPERRK